MAHHAVTLLTILALLFASGTAVAGDHHCAASTMPSAACCCDHSSDADEAEQRGPELQGICCELRAPSDSAPPASPAALDGQAPDVLAAPLTTVSETPTLRHTLVHATEGAPPPVRGPPLFVRNCRFLI